MLDQIFEETKTAVAHRMKTRSLEQLKALVSPTTRSLAKALKKNRSAVILECKKASPSRGIIRPNFDIVEIIKIYDQFADAISVITNATFFGGSLELLQRARRLTDKPLLCKDFVLTPYQVFEARHFEADAVLLMMSLLRDDDFRLCFEAAASLNMDVLVEVHDKEELDRALLLGAKIIGVNNRDFRTLKVDVTTAEHLLPQIPDERIAVFESGIETHQQLHSYEKIADAFLVGTSLMKREDLGRAVRELVFGRVKVCGLTRNEDALFAQACGAVFGGLIFASESPRCVSLEQARDVMVNCDLDFVGVFVNQPLDLIVGYVKQLKLKAVQLHGDENVDFIRELRRRLPATCEIWKVVRVKDELPPPPSDFRCDRILLDTFHPDQRGGTGQTFAWGKTKALISKDSYILSGGLSVENAKEACAQGLWALDVNSKVETSPGVKNHDLLRAFFEELR